MDDFCDYFLYDYYTFNIMQILRLYNKIVIHVVIASIVNRFNLLLRSKDKKDQV